jgi:hypothetical protein
MLQGVDRQFAARRTVLNDNVVTAQPFQVIAHGQSSLAAAHNYGVDPLQHNVALG